MNLVEQARQVADKPELLGEFVAQIDTDALARRVRHRLPMIDMDEAISLVFDAILTTIRSPALKNTRNFLHVVTLQAVQDGYRQTWAASSMLSGTSSQQWRYHEVVKTRRQFEARGQSYTDNDLIRVTNERLASTRKDVKRQGMIVTAADLAMGRGMGELPVSLSEHSDQLDGTDIIADVTRLATQEGLPAQFATWFTRHCVTTGATPGLPEIRDWGLDASSREHMLAIITTYVKGPQRGFFISVEGIHGAGVSTVARALRNGLKPLHRDIVTIRLKDSHDENPRMWALAMMRDVAEMAGQIRTSLDAGALVIADRWMPHVIAGGEARGLDMDQLTTFVGWSAGDLMPDMTILVDVDPALANDRHQAQFPAFEEWEREALLVLAEKEPEWWLVADGAVPKKKMLADVLAQALHEIAG